MANFLVAKKLMAEINSLLNRKHKNYCFILAENVEDEARQILENEKPNTTFIIVRKDRWEKKIPINAV